MHALRGRNVRRARERGAAMAELAILLPVVITTLLAVIDFGRLVYCHQVATDLTREAANLVSRGTSVTDAWNAAASADGPIQIDDDGAMIVSVIRRKSATDPTPVDLRADQQRSTQDREEQDRRLSTRKPRFLTSRRSPPA